MAQREFTGRHALMIFVGVFGVIFAVNFFMAYSAVSTFPGLEVKNSYVASQSFDDRRAEQEALGWDVKAEAEAGQVRLYINDDQGAPVEVTALDATLGRATHTRDDSEPSFVFDGISYVAPVALGDGNWNIRMKAVARDGTEFTQRVVLHVKR
ncbi:FixH family protein [Thalassococcus sp. S3]|uniref:FixH family protein n=1 Tax=Thalassococcus sp. S3 TaxID=2017482 RepID=UPI001023F69E|nr:FixH family protein [Thalassococcus sp. S3]QBF30332.1 nitrogen fixation protein FixH [Thalassococcus sp. S3]